MVYGIAALRSYPDNVIRVYLSVLSFCLSFFKMEYILTKWLMKWWTPCLISLFCFCLTGGDSWREGQRKARKNNPSLQTQKLGYARGTEYSKQVLLSSSFLVKPLLSDKIRALVTCSQCIICALYRVCLFFNIELIHKETTIPVSSLGEVKIYKLLSILCKCKMWCM